MYVLLILLSILLIIVLLIAIVPLKIKFTMKSEEPLDFDLRFSWLLPFLKAIIQTENQKIVQTIYLFNEAVYKKNIRLKSNVTGSNINLMNLVKQIKPTHIGVRTSYGFADPSITGITCGIINVLSEYINLDSLYNNPNFNTDDSYFNIDAQMNVNLALLIIKYLHYKQKNNSKQFLYPSR